MKAVKKILIALGVLVVIYVVLCLFGPAHIRVERDATINASAEAIWPEVSNFENWENWSHWATIDPDGTEYTYSGTPGTVGHKNDWTSEHEMVGVGSQEITEITEYQNIKTKMWFEGQGEAFADMVLTANDDGTTSITWGFDMDVPFMGRAFMLFMNMDEMLGGDLEKGLDRLNTHIAGSVEEEVAFEASEVNVDPFWIISIRDTITMEDMATIHQDLYMELGGCQAENGIEQAASPIAIWHSWGEEIVIEAGIPVPDSVELVNPGRIVCRQIEAGKCVKTTHLGWYDSLESTHMAFEDWLAENSYTMGDQPRWEQYEDPSLVLPDTNAVATHIYIPVN